MYLWHLSQDALDTFFSPSAFKKEDTLATACDSSKEGGVFLKCEAFAVADALAGEKKFVCIFLSFCHAAINGEKIC